MAYSIIQQGDTVDTYIMEVMVDNKSDVATLPVNWQSGSSCIVLEDTSVWMLGNDKVWHEI